MSIAEIKHWKPIDVEFSDADRAVIAESIGAPVEDVRWEIVSHEILGGVVGHCLIGRNFDL